MFKSSGNGHGMQAGGRQRTLCPVWRWAGEQNGQSDIGCVCNLAPHLPLALSTVGGSGSAPERLQLAAGSGATHILYIQYIHKTSDSESVSQTEKSSAWNETTAMHRACSNKSAD